jgi:putative FmdB family regulatory protein
MPIFEYQSDPPERGCSRCAKGFAHLHRGAEASLTHCPDCGAPLRRLISAPAVGASKSGFDARAKAAGFHKLKRLGRGEFEKQY